MTPVLVILLPADGEPCPWLTVSPAGAVLERGAAAPGDPIPDPGGVTVVIVPGQDVLIRTLDVPGRTGAQATAAATWSLRDALGQNPDRVQVVLGPVLSAGGPRIVAVVARGMIEAWSVRVEALGLKADVILPDCLLLDPPPDPEGLRAFRLGDRVLVRGAGLAFSGESDTANFIVADRRTTFEAPDAFEGFAVRKALAPEINLLFREPPGRFSPREWLRAGMLTAALMLSPLLHLGAATVADDLAARRLEAASRAAVLEVFPDAGGEFAPLDEVRQRSREGPYPGGALPAAAMLAQALQQQVGMRLESFSLDGGRVRATVSYEAPSDLQSLVSGVQRQGADLTVVGTADEEGRTTAELILWRPA